MSSGLARPICDYSRMVCGRQVKILFSKFNAVNKMGGSRGDTVLQEVDIFGFWVESRTTYLILVGQTSTPFGQTQGTEQGLWLIVFLRTHHPSWWCLVLPGLTWAAHNPTLKLQLQIHSWRTTDKQSLGDLSTSFHPKKFLNHFSSLQNRGSNYMPNPFSYPPQKRHSPSHGYLAATHRGS